jgi:cell division protein FtsL
MEEYNEEYDYDAELNESKKGKLGSYKDVLDGSLLTRGAVVKQFPFVIFLVILAVIYIGNRYHAEKNCT